MKLVILSLMAMFFSVTLLHAEGDAEMRLVQGPGTGDAQQSTEGMFVRSDETGFANASSKLGNEATSLGLDLQSGPGQKSAFGTGGGFESPPVLKPMDLELPMTAAIPPPPIETNPEPE